MAYRRPTGHHRTRKNIEFLSFLKKWCWRSSFEVPPFSFRRMLRLIWLFCFQNPLWPGCPPRGPKATPKAPFWAPLGLPWLPFGVTLNPSGLLFGSQWGAKGCQSAPMGLPSAPKRASYAFQRRSIWLSRAPKEVLKGSQGGCFNDGNPSAYCLGSRVGVILSDSYRNIFPDEFCSPTRLA